MTAEEFVKDFNKKKNEKKGSTNLKGFNKLIRHTVSKSLDDLKKEGDEAYAVKMASDASILEAYKGKKLKSKTLIKRGKYLFTKEKEKEQQAAETAVTDEIKEN